jgi:hypothetical protein
MNEEELGFNKHMASMRMSVEWGFGEQLMKWHFIAHKYNLKVGLSPIGAYYSVTVLLCNLHVCLNGSAVSRKFGLNPPSIREYLHPDVPSPDPLPQPEVPANLG